MDAIALYLTVGCFHVSLRYLIDWGRLAENRQLAGSQLYVLLGKRFSPDALVAIQIAVGIFVWPIGVVSVFLRVLGIVR